MKKLTFDEKNFYVDGVPTYFNCGEFHYFRVPKSDWERRMQLLKAAGGNAVATYIPWSVHEPEEGNIQFDLGNGYTDLTDFLECAKKVGLYVVARPGPYSYSELVNDGLPAWLMEKYPQILAQKRDGSRLRSSSVSYLHPVFLEKAHAYYKAVCPIIARYTQENGGPVAMVQLDNELTGIHVWFGDRDFNRETMGFDTEDGLYPAWLKEKYGTVDAANAAYGTSKKSFSEFYPEDEPASGVEKVTWNADYIEFYNGTVALYLEKLMGYAEESGVHCAFCHNAANPWMDVVFREAKRRFGTKLLIGSDHYFTLNQTWQQNNPTPQFMIYCFMSSEMLRLMGNPPCIFETQYGSICQWPPTSAEDIEALLMCQAASGVRGHNGYVFTGGPNPPEQGTTCEVYDYDAPVSATGECRPSYDALRRFGAFMEQHPELASDKPAADVRVAMPWRCFTGAGGKVHSERAAELGTLAHTFQTGLLSGIFAANLQPEFINTETDDWTGNFDTPVFVTTDGVMSAAEQTRIAGFIKNGGHVIFSPVIPFLDERLKPCTILSDTFGATSGKQITTGALRCDFRSGDFANVQFGELFAAGTIPEGARILGSELESGACVGWTVPAGKGSFSWFGVSTVLVRGDHIHMIRAMFEAAGGKALWRSNNSWVLTYRRNTSKGLLVFLANLGTSHQTVRAEYRKDAGSPWKQLPEVTLSAMEIKVISL